MKKKGNKKTPSQGRKPFNPIPTSLLLLAYSSIAIGIIKAQSVKLCIKKNKDVGMGLDVFLSWVGVFLFPFFFKR